MARWKKVFNRIVVLLLFILSIFGQNEHKEEKRLRLDAFVPNVARVIKATKSYSICIVQTGVSATRFGNFSKIWAIL